MFNCLFFWVVCSKKKITQQVVCWEFVAWEISTNWEIIFYQEVCVAVAKLIAGEGVKRGEEGTC